MLKTQSITNYSIVVFLDPLFSVSRLKFIVKDLIDHDFYSLAPKQVLCDFSCMTYGLHNAFYF